VRWCADVINDARVLRESFTLVNYSPAI